MSLSPKLKIRLLAKKDKEIVLKWANERVTRRFSLNPKKIGETQHERWFQTILRSRSANPAFIIQNENRVRIGIVRFSQFGEMSKKWKIHFTVAPEQRGKGLAAPMIRKAMRRLFKNHPRSKVCAIVKKHNYRSRDVLRSLGFRVLRKNKKNRNIFQLEFGPLKKNRSKKIAGKQKF